jgi:preprotein translocase subunit SecB
MNEETGLSMTCYLSVEEVEAVTHYLVSQGIPVTDAAIRKQARIWFHEKQQVAKEHVEQQPVLNPMPHDIQLEDIFLYRLSVQRSPELPGLPKKYTASLNIVSVDVAGTTGVAHIEAHIGALPHDEINVVLCGVFRSHGQYSDAQYTEFLRCNSLSLLLPFMRETLYDLSMRMRLNPPVLLSLVVVAKSSEEKGKQDG